MVTSADPTWDRGKRAEAIYEPGHAGGVGERPDVDLPGLLRAGVVRFEAALGLLGIATLVLFFPLEFFPLILLIGGGACFWSARAKAGNALRFIGRWMPRATRQPGLECLRSGQPVLGLYIAVSILMANVIFVRMAGDIFNTDPQTRPVIGQAGEFEVVMPWLHPAVPTLIADGLHWLCVAGIAALIHFRTAYVEAHRRLQMAELMDEMREARSRRFASDYAGGDA